jgi:hypothetical protein
MSKRNSGTPVEEPTHFGWAIDHTGNPTPIALAQPDGAYTCPVCGGEMKPTRRGKFPSYNHKSLSPCTPAEVAAESSIHWLANTLQYYVKNGEECHVHWGAEGGDYESDWLGGVKRALPFADTPYGKADLALLGDGDEVKSVFFTHRPDADTMKAFADAGVPVALPQALPFLEGQVTLGILLRDMDVFGGWWLVHDDDNDPNLLTKPAILWQIFREVIGRQPYSYCARLESFGNYDYVMTVGESRLWLPMELWDAVFGGTRNRINRELTIISNQWQQEDDSVIELFYVIVQKRIEFADRQQERAVGLRRHFPQEGGILRSGLDYAIKPNANAEEIACALVRSRTGSLNL